MILVTYLTSSSYLQISLWFVPTELVTVNPVKLHVPYGNSFKSLEGITQCELFYRKFLKNGNKQDSKMSENVVPNTVSVGKL